MKLLLATAFLSATLASADPKVGDQAILEGTATTNGQAAPITMVQEVTSVNPETRRAQVKIIVVIAERAEEQTQEQTFEDLAVPTVDQIRATCSEQGGTFETVTVPAGAFEACTVIQEAGPVKMSVTSGAVPFKVVKTSQEMEGSSVAMELKSFKYGE
jgi:hypothetical protein